ncbi:hypothetical protein THIX_70122 [Thiomonas sp. X19]|nr:hypothetical protein THIX_70122 [Thiomonas sp. X19]
MAGIRRDEAAPPGRCISLLGGPDCWVRVPMGVTAMHGGRDFLRLSGMASVTPARERALRGLAACHAFRNPSCRFAAPA